MAKTCFLGQKKSFFRILAEIKKQGHFSYQKNQSFQNLGSDFEKRHFLHPLEGFLAFLGRIMPFLEQGTIENNFSIILYV